MSDIRCGPLMFCIPIPTTRKRGGVGTIELLYIIIVFMSVSVSMGMSMRMRMVPRALEERPKSPSRATLYQTVPSTFPSLLVSYYR